MPKTDSNEIEAESFVRSINDLRMPIQQNTGVPSSPQEDFRQNPNLRRHFPGALNDPRSSWSKEDSDGPFAFPPSQPNKLQEPKSLAAWRALGGLQGLEKGLESDVIIGPRVDKTSKSKKGSLEEAQGAANVIIGPRVDITSKSKKGSLEEAKGAANTKKQRGREALLQQNITVSDHKVKGQAGTSDED